MTYIKQQKRQEQMWKPVKRNQVFSPLEICILKNLAENDSQTINETAKAINKQYKSTFRIFTSLKKKGIIKKTTFKEHRGRKYPRYWLTELGIYTALIEGANPTTLLEKAVKTYPDNENLHLLLGMAPFTGIEVFRMAFSTIRNKGQLEQSDMDTIILTVAQRNLSTEQCNQFLRMLREHPDEYERVTEKIKRLAELLEKKGEVTNFTA